MKHCFARLQSAILGSETYRHQRFLTSQSLLVLGVYIAFAFVQHAEVRLGLIDASASWKLTAWNLCGGFGFYAIARSGLNQRIGSSRDRSLSIPQSVWAMIGITWSYAITGPARGAVILIMLLVLIYGVFTLTPAQSRLLVALGFFMLASVMVFKAVTDPVGYDPRVESMHLIFAGIVMMAVSALSMRLGRLKRSLEQRRNELFQALQRIQTLAACDELTGLSNRRAALDKMNQNLASLSQGEMPERPRLIVALIDIDHFKRINDGFGHAAGDEVLKRVAAIGQSVVREDDMLARWGGEEFLLVMPDGTVTQIDLALARWRDLLRAESFDDIAANLQISFSAGVAECWDSTDIDGAIARADAAMYTAKHCGRDRVQHSVLPSPADKVLPSAGVTPRTATLPRPERWTGRRTTSDQGNG